MKRLLYWTVMAFLAAVLAVSGKELGGYAVETGTEKKKNEELKNAFRITASDPEAELPAVCRDHPDFAGWLRFEDDWISEPVVQGKDHSYYLDHWLDGSQAHFGTVFIDPQGSLQAQNITLYGHHVFDDGSLKFGPLCQLMSQEVYDRHKCFELILPEETRRYQIVYVISYEETGEFCLPFSSPAYDPDTYREYMDYLDRNNLVDSGLTIPYGTPMVTMQTCLELNRPVRLLVIAMETRRLPQETGS